MSCWEGKGERFGYGEVFNMLHRRVLQPDAHGPAAHAQTTPAHRSWFKTKNDLDRVLATQITTIIDP